MTSEISPFPPPPPPEPAQYEMSSDSEDDEAGGIPLDGPLSAEDRLLLMTDGLSEASGSIFAHRVMCEYYAFLDEHQSVVELARAGKVLVGSESAKTGLKFASASEALTALLGTSLVYYQSPKNHPEAKSLFNEILSQNPTSTPALIGIGLIYEDEEDYPAAIDFLDRALLRDPNNIRVRAEVAWVRALNGDYEVSKDDLEACLTDMEGSDTRTRELRAQTLYRIGVCMWHKDTSKEARKDRAGAYSYFLSALKANLNFAPAYTSLGIYYADYSKDRKRARKCFQKAFELSASEVEAAERLARSFAEQGEWDLVEVVSQRVVDSGKVRPSPGSKKKGFSWPFAALGVAELNKQDYAKSIVSFQSALRISPNDYHSWVGLGESYHHSGRYIAATKAFQHAEKFEQEVEERQSGDTWFAKYMLSNVKRELGDYEEAIDGYKAVLSLRNKEYGVSIALIQTLVDNAWDSVDKGLFGQAAGLAGEAITAALDLVKDGSDGFNLWKSIGDACSVFSWIQSRTSEFPKDQVKQLLDLGDAKEAYELFADVDAVGRDIIFSQGLFPQDEEEGIELTRCMQAAILAHKRAIHASSHDIHAQAVAYFNLGWTEHRAHITLVPDLKKKSTRYLKAAVRCFKRAIELEAGNAEFWNALGVVTSDLNPKVAQHSFVRSLYLNERSAQAWTNLGTLYLLQNDHQLANEAFTRAQSTDPDFAHAWLGQGIIALLLGDPKEAKLLFTHAAEISESSSLLTKRQYALAMFDHIVTSATGSSIVDLVQPLFAVHQLNSLTPRDLPYQHLSTLLSERIGDISSAITTLSSICARVEADYEVSESPTSLSQFALGKTDLARCQLAAHQYEEAIESAETAIQLSAEDAGNELSEEARRKCRLSAHLTMGLAQYYNKNNDQAAEYFQIALEESKGNPDAVCLLAQVLWAQGGNDARAKARDHLFDCVENYPGHVQSVLLLGIIALLDEDRESLEAVTADLQALRTSQKVTDKEQAKIGEVLRAIAALASNNAEIETMTEIQTDIMLFPHQPHGWGRMADLSGDEFTAEMALRTALKAVAPKGDLGADDLAVAFAGTGKLGDAQKSAFIAPWKVDGWKALTGTNSA
jgi:superkiller protein 3